MCQKEFYHESLNDDVWIYSSKNYSVPAYKIITDVKMEYSDVTIIKEPSPEYYAIRELIEIIQSQEEEINYLRKCE